ncbi:hypothetical protein BN961_03548 [Afipia felis]|uniref:Uncharacterized protein n=1 Tax=Afipia felis TaxID=1035 RepID=A0A090N8I9_AFIFE|nr:hypothetical protein BN961_03548 [Afipia felis]
MQGFGQSGHGAWHTDTERTIARFLRIRLAVRPQKHRRRRGFRCSLAIVERDAFVLARQMDHHEAAAAEIARARIGHRHREPGRDRRIHGIAATFEHVGAKPRGDLFLRDHHAVACEHRLCVSRQRRDAGILCQSGGRQQHQQQGKSKAVQKQAFLFRRNGGAR